MLPDTVVEAQSFYPQKDDLCNRPYNTFSYLELFIQIVMTQHLVAGPVTNMILVLVVVLLKWGR